MAAAQLPPVIVVPGIKGSGLEDYYPIARQELWSAVLTKEYERVAMHPDDLRYEALEPAQVRASSPFAIAYKELVEALRYELTPDPRKPVPVFAFGYDWRQDCLLSAAQLGAMIEEVLARTRLLPHYRDEPPSHVDVVAHSMGGIVAGLLLAERGAKARIRRVVTLGAPLRGAIDACSMLAMGQGNFWGEVSRDAAEHGAAVSRFLVGGLHNAPRFLLLGARQPGARAVRRLPRQPAGDEPGAAPGDSLPAAGLPEPRVGASLSRRHPAFLARMAGRA